eukprot:Seg20393.1 transcript_id=Seg20393.1/GoldUCD/mRNA.D3Y31 product="hypothetical protein" protein_id=Seg20393.1/GoldUCD/D3Y31
MNPKNQSEEITGELEVSSVDPKFFLKSKTILGLIILLLAVAQYLGVDTMKMSDEARNLLATASGILIILGIRTADRPLTFKTNISNKSPIMVFGVLGSVVGCMAFCGLSSCNSAIRGGIQYQHDSGAKGGLRCDEDGCEAYGKVPFVDEDGNVVGEGDIVIPFNAKGSR